ncbi:MAG: thiamine phosphate synthase [Prevotella sp.]|uniref:thiamine phosphate synthase n=1 Tax=Prevotella sp. TaxID=59823 RepID=UPI002A253295|nr:thiamine phosphate synthase [Prevotella sp.]MDD7317253.1 thiamine phosphate synthase [Prevotellaceae bacterium]MDY4019857.1 thiamine phosphate synthase [Prevotella sp.]
MRLIAITKPCFTECEAGRIKSLLEREGYWAVHLRKPENSRAEYAAILNSLPEKCLSRIVVHDHFDLIRDYPLMGIHLNGRHPEPPEWYEGQISCSCHSLEEVEARKPHMDYVFLSPIFDSISKEGYTSEFCHETLERAAGEGIIDEKVIALGGITPDKITYLESLHFGGVAMLGYVWRQ